MISALLPLLLAASSLNPTVARPEFIAALPKLTVKGTDLLDPSGKRVILKGANLGNWHVIEFWMLGNAGDPGIPGDQFRLEELLTKRFGEAKKEQLMETYRESWLKKRDFDILKSFKFNLVRLPMNYRLMEDDRHPFKLKPNAFKWIDRAVDLAESRGMYVLLDMHGAQGGQSPYDHTGQSDQNHLKDSPEAQKRLAWLWGKLAARYRNRSAVMGYDTFNEPYGTPKPIQVEVFKQVYQEIRKVDPDKLVFAHGNYDDFYHYGDPKANGWHNVGFQMHYYPGLFGNGSPTVKTQLSHLATLPALRDRIKKLNVPFIVGEMNAVFNAAGGADMMRKTFDAHASYGWLTTMWSYKALSKEGGIGDATWGCVSNANPMPKINFETDSEATIESYFETLGTQKLIINEPLRKALSDPNYKVKPFAMPQMRVTATQDILPGWTSTDIGGALKGGLQRRPNGEFDLFGGGNDIWGDRDEFRFLHQTLDGNGILEATVTTVEDLGPYTKSGLMLRADLSPESPFLLVSIFPSGEIQIATRTKRGESASGSEATKANLPNIALRITRDNGTIKVEYATESGTYLPVKSVPDFLPKSVQAGPISLSHSPAELVKIGYRGLKLTRSN